MYDFDPKKDYYKMLDVSEDATQDEIKKAFKKLAVKHHPDKWGDQAEFQKINEAHQILSDEGKRQQYDTVRKGWFGWFGGTWWWWGGFGWFGWWVDLGDVVSSIFGWGFGWGWGWGWNKSRRGEDIKDQLGITFEESFLWTEKKIAYTRLIITEWAKKETCTKCNGRGSSVQQVQTPFGVMQTEAACPKCQWLGGVYKKDGKDLPNNWLERHRETLTVKIPAGINNDVYIKYPGKGHTWVGDAPIGDLYIKIDIKASKEYSRKGEDLYVRTDVSLFDLVLGGQCEVPHPEGKLKVKVPKGTQVWDLIKVTGKGFGEAWVFRSKGSLYIEPQVHIPKRLTKDQEKLWKELQKAN